MRSQQELTQAIINILFKDGEIMGGCAEIMKAMENLTDLNEMETLRELFLEVKENYKDDWNKIVGGLNCDDNNEADAIRVIERLIAKTKKETDTKISDEYKSIGADENKAENKVKSLEARVKELEILTAQLSLKIEQLENNQQAQILQPPKK